MAGRLARLVGGPHDGLELHVQPEVATLFLRPHRPFSWADAFGFQLSELPDDHEYRYTGMFFDEGVLRFEYREKAK